MSERREELIPALGVVTEIRKDTPDVKTFRVVTPDGKKAFEHKPGQCAMLSVPGVGEGMFSITSSPTQEEYMEFSIKKCGCLTSWLHAIEPGQMITIRGPYGNGFPVDTELKGKNLLFIAGGIGLAPLHSVINYCRHYRDQLNLSLDKTILICGPPIMIKFTLQNLQALGFSKSQVYTTMELRMKCGIGKCGRCNIGSKYVCKDGPVFRFDQLDELPDEY